MNPTVSPRRKAPVSVKPKAKQPTKLQTKPLTQPVPHRRPPDWLLGVAKPTPLRLWWVGAILLAGGVGLLAKLYTLQVVGVRGLRDYANGQQHLAKETFIPRRLVQDRAGNTLAMDRKTFELFVHPKNFTLPAEAVAKQLAPILQRSPAELEKVFASQTSGIRLEQSISQQVGDRVANLELNGLELLPLQERFYPQGRLFGDILGFVDGKNQGQAGLEQSQQRLLRYFRPQLQLTKTGEGLALPNNAPLGSFNQDDRHLQLTLDSRLQEASRQALQKQMRQFNANRGTVIVMDAKDGSLLALANEPTYDPNQYYKAPIELYKNWALSDRYEPGSTFKPINVAIALETGAVSPDASYYDGGQTTIGGYVIGNVGNAGHGVIGIPEILQVSSNIGMIQIMQNLKPSLYYSWLEKLGLNGKPIAIDLPSDIAGYMKSKSIFLENPVEPAVTAFGQGFALTPLKLVQLHGILANGGQMVTPHVVKALVNEAGEAVGEQPQVPPPQRIFSPKTAKTVVEMMETVVMKGSGQPAQIPGYRIGGKTGTAQKASPTGGYLNNAKITSFVSILPVNKPRYVVAVIVDEPQGGNTFGSTVAAPVAKEVMESLIVLNGIPPTGSTKPKP